MTTRTETYSHINLKKIQEMEDSGWSVRLIVPLGRLGFVVVYEREVL